jgi:hypothetical protein
MKKTILIGLICFALLGGYLFYRLNPKYGWILVNRLTVVAPKPLLREKVRISKGLYSIGRKNDKKLFRSPATLIFDGKSCYDTAYEYGENDFLITYDEEYYYQFRQFKFSNRPKHHYHFTLSPSTEGMLLRVNIEGEDAMQFERLMNRISDAEKLRCNVPKEKAGVMYNMKELVTH